MVFKKVIELVSLSGTFIGYISEQKAQWYIGKNIAKMNNETKCQLLFEPKFRNEKGSQLPSTFKFSNKCAVCGEKNKLYSCSLVRKNLKKLLPSEYKTKRSHSFIPVCVNCMPVINSMMDDDLKEYIGFYDTDKSYDVCLKEKAKQIIEEKISPYDLEKFFAQKFYDGCHPQNLFDAWFKFYDIQLK